MKVLLCVIEGSLLFGWIAPLALGTDALVELSYWISSGTNHQHSFPYHQFARNMVTLASIWAFISAVYYFVRYARPR